ncbi:glycosyltransferase family 4 protein [Natronorubrum sulfidifaciens]|uniref:Group 1 glycosyl transferase n=1 Tax=Natronorubrum sulfidifaciens JCM 14089 TaxID=1230460 RepID=L9WBA4_9EURY|nr:glycosyltransferase [Natronorubrum sulfidifaciens]ELY45578.1 group 1 glycosyl transferase [Natronorubrum sulfidifaciens JCM 14089]
MRILRVAQKVYPDVKGGGPYHVHAMSRDQATMGHDVTVLTVRTDPELPHVEERDGYTVVRYDPAVTLLGNDISPGLAQYLSSAEDFDVMHAHSHLYFATNLAALKRFLGDIPLAITNHGLYSQNAPEWVFDLYLRTLGRWTFNQADVVFCYTGTDKQRVRDFGVSSPIEVVSNGIDTERFTPEGPESELVDAEGPVVLFVGRLVEGKRPWLVVEAFAEVLDEHHGAELYLCGGGPLRDDLEARVRELGIESSISFLGQVPYDEMPAVYRSADALVLPSRSEGVPRTIMEALSAELSVVSSELVQVQSAFGDAVTYVPEAEAFGGQLVDVLNDGRKRSGLNEQFCWARTVEETTTVVARVVNDSM